MAGPRDDYPRLISLAVHELRTPASVVAGYLRMLQRDSEPMDERHRKMVEEAARSCGRMVELIAALSEVGKLDEGLIAMAPRPIDVFKLVEEVAASVHEPTGREVRLRATGAGTGGIIAGDAPRLTAAFDAIFHAILREKVGPCTIVAHRRLDDGGGVRSAVIIVAEEAGVQAAYDAAPAAFDEKRGGVGLSLPIARRVIEAHGGRVWSPRFDDARLARSTALVALPLGAER